MITYAVNYYDKLLICFVQHIELVVVTMLISVVAAAMFTFLSLHIPILKKGFVYFFSLIYSIPSLALFAMLIPVTGLGKKTAILVLVIYNQYLLLRNFIEGLDQVDESIIEAAKGLGMTTRQVLWKVRIPLSKEALFTGIHLSIVSTIGIATIAASIHAGGLGTILLDGLRTVNIYKILWGSILSAGLAIAVNTFLNKLEQKL